jgi:hypothetical protein
MDGRANKRALTIQGAAEYACVSRGMIVNWLTAGLLPCEELPGRGKGVYRFRRIRLADLDEFLDRSHRSADGSGGKRKTAGVVLLRR